MGVFILACAASLIPFLLLFLWLRKRGKEKENDKLFGKALVKGFISTVPIVLLSMLFNILLRLARVEEFSPLLFQGLYTFIVLALSEEIVKFATARKLMKTADKPLSVTDVTVITVIVGIGFGMLESVIYMIGANVPTVLVRGICMPHAGYGFITGYFFGRGLQKDSRPMKWTGFVLSWLMHGVYDFALTDEFMKLGEDLAIVAVSLAIADIALVIGLISFVKRAKKREDMNVPIINTPDDAAPMPDNAAED
ncbi:MAG: PrsW family intramembrane metalloprotease [Oscillospiraceae bacterium]|nr:PrsW family intramembrane metalloprotease [Oscillospiraceae bacterium]